MGDPDVPWQNADSGGKGRGLSGLSRLEPEHDSMEETLQTGCGLIQMDVGHRGSVGRKEKSSSGFVLLEPQVASSIGKTIFNQWLWGCGMFQISPPELQWQPVGGADRQRRLENKGFTKVVDFPPQNGDALPSTQSLTGVLQHSATMGHPGPGDSVTHWATAIKLQLTPSVKKLRYSNPEQDRDTNTLK